MLTNNMISDSNGGVKLNLHHSYVSGHTKVYPETVRDTLSLSVNFICE